MSRARVNFETKCFTKKVHELKTALVPPIIILLSSDFVFRKYKQDSAFRVSGVLQLAKTGPPVTKNFPLLRLFLSDAMMALGGFTHLMTSTVLICIF